MPITIDAFDPADTERVVELWDACGLLRPWNDPYKDIERKLAVQPELFLVARRSDDERPVGTAMAGYDGHRGWVYYLAVDPAARGRGHGRALMREVEARLTAMGCPKLNLQIRAGNDAVARFYESAGYVREDTTGFGKRLIAD